MMPQASNECDASTAPLKGLVGVEQKQAYQPTSKDPKHAKRKHFKARTGCLTCRFVSGAIVETYFH